MQMKKGGKTSQLEKIESLLRHGKIGRREFIDRLPALRLNNDLLTMTEGRLFQCLQTLSRQHPINLSMKTMPQFGNLMV